MAHQTAKNLPLPKDVENKGERVSPKNRNQNFALHITVYEFIAEKVKDKSVADIGSGSGYGSLLFAQSGAKVVHGYEFSQDAINFSNETCHAPNLKYFQADMNQPLAAQQKYDLIFSSNAFEHFMDLPQALQNVSNMLAKNGEFVLVVPCIMETSRLHGEYKNYYHLANLSLRMWLRTMQRCFRNVTTYIQAVHCSNETYERLSPEERKRKDKNFASFVELIGDPVFNDMDQFKFEYANVAFICSNPTGVIDMASYVECPISSVRELAYHTDPGVDWTFSLMPGDSVQREIPIKGWLGGIMFYLGDCNRRGGGIAEIELKVSRTNGPCSTKQMLYNINNLSVNNPTLVDWPFYREPIFVPDDAHLIMTIRSHGYHNTIFNVMLGAATTQEEEKPFCMWAFRLLAPIPSP